MNMSGVISSCLIAVQWKLGLLIVPAGEIIENIAEHVAYHIL